MKNTQILISFMLILLLVSCDSKKLTREKAKEIIIEIYDYPNIHYINVGSEFYCWKLNGFNKRAIDNNLLSKKRTFSSNKNCWFTKITPTRLGKPFLIEKLKSKEESVTYENVYMLSKASFDKITGIKISDGATSADVIFSIRHTNVTPFGTLQNLKENGTQEFTVQFELFDDGWRIINDKTKIYKKEDYPNLQL